MAYEQATMLWGEKQTTQLDDGERCHIVVTGGGSGTTLWHTLGQSQQTHVHNLP